MEVLFLIRDRYLFIGIGSKKKSIAQIYHFYGTTKNNETDLYTLI